MFYTLMNKLGRCNVVILFERLKDYSDLFASIYIASEAPVSVLEIYVIKLGNIRISSVLFALFDLIMISNVMIHL